MSLVSKNIKVIIVIVFIIGIFSALIYIGVISRNGIKKLENDVSELKSVLRHISIQLSSDKNLAHSFYKGFKNDVDDSGKEITKWISQNY